MAIPLLTTLPQPPLPSDPEEIFDSKAGATLLAQKTLVDEMNTSTIPGINAVTGGIQASVDAAAASAAAALLSKNDAAQSVLDAAEQVQLAADQVALAEDQVALSVIQANNAQASAIAAESAQGSIGNLALIHALTLAL